MRRRTFIGLSALAAAGAGAAYWARDWLLGTRPTDLPGAEETLQAMVAMVGPVLGNPASPRPRTSVDSYRELFQWRFRNLPLERDRQQSFARLLNELARGKIGSTFARCDEAARREILAAALDSPDGRDAGVWLTGLIVRLFARTDSWLLLGYESPPGNPRGLELYVQSPR